MDKRVQTVCISVSSHWPSHCSLLYLSTSTQGEPSHGSVKCCNEETPDCCWGHKAQWSGHHLPHYIHNHSLMTFFYRLNCLNDHKPWTWYSNTQNLIILSCLHRGELLSIVQMWSPLPRVRAMYTMCTFSFEAQVHSRLPTLSCHARCHAHAWQMRDIVTWIPGGYDTWIFCLSSGDWLIIQPWHVQCGGILLQFRRNRCSNVLFMKQLRLFAMLNCISI